MVHTLRRALERFIWCTAAYFPPGRVLLPHCGCWARIDRALFRVLSARGRFIRCTAACSPPSRGEAAPPRPLQVPWGPAPCLVPHFPALLPRCACWACAGIAGGPLTPSRPQRTRVLYPVYCSVFSARPRRGRSLMSSTSPPGCTPYLGPCSPALLPHCGCWDRTDTAGGPHTPPSPQRTRAIYPMHCSVFSARPGGDHPSTTSTVPLVVRSIPRSLFPSVTSSLWAPDRHRHRRWIAHSVVPSVHMGALSDVL
ncbi:hypothetical protein NDU88_005560 [Pleurodeles waltl]|uniref:Uncharacterized protein n=1 Tax=Pleurodeles waltl TaxID=8319 RepID=A0AAV7QLB7_PLEWA|nr:hypothetical protein NDU88_005560 [Pleurodeles waltl]